MPETTPLIKAALNLRGGAGFDVYEKTLTSSMTIDDAYLLVTGMSYDQFKDYEKTEMEKMKKGEKKESSRENILECKSNKIIC